MYYIDYINYLFSYPNRTIRTLTEDWQIDKIINLSRKLLFCAISVYSVFFKNNLVLYMFSYMIVFSIVHSRKNHFKMNDCDMKHTLTCLWVRVCFLHCILLHIPSKYTKQLHGSLTYNR